MIRVSTGTAACMGLSNTRMDAYPKTAYLLSGKSCLMNCSFCPQGTGKNEGLKRLGRVTWPEYPWVDINDSLIKAQEKGFRRICLQSVRHRDGIETLLGLIDRIKQLSELPISLSAWIQDEKEAALLVEAGVERINLSLDVVNPSAYKELKGGSLDERLDLLLSCARNLPARISTHIICGLGESEAEALSLVDKLVEAKVTVALFAFVPLKGTPLEKWISPSVDSYRRIQAGSFLLRTKLAGLSSFEFAEGRLVSFGIPAQQLRLHLSDGFAFQTSGCPDCNRPFYNERPGGIIYNYHRELNNDEIEKALEELLDSLEMQAF